MDLWSGRLSALLLVNIVFLPPSPSSFSRKDILNNTHILSNICFGNKKLRPEILFRNRLMINDRQRAYPGQYQVFGCLVCQRFERDEKDTSRT